MTITFHPPGRKLPPDHPFATPQIVFVPKRQQPSTPNSAEQNSAPTVGMDDPAWMAKMQDHLDKAINEEFQKKGTGPQGKPPSE